MERAMEPHPSTLICASHFMLAAGQIYSQHCRTLHDKTSKSRVVKKCKEQSQIVSSRVYFEKKIGSDREKRLKVRG